MNLCSMIHQLKENIQPQIVDPHMHKKTTDMYAYTLTQYVQAANFIK